ncbi:hypothetical protein G3567_12520 [Psychroflexus sp. YR1-1]|uniref:Uncharacterized protein n=1 Tax=Psychroflexus aurantiacus TaxID=2709310 RepID=A0A6B3R3C7_9FLAO|nr:hypothetical protein [Psychroflexus aurantiacus]NEV94963.1 hypothetical protein [Psychroflexus aurantiacus]
MEANIEYISFNNDKNIDELLYNIDLYKIRLKELRDELRFCKFLIETNNFKPKVINLFETLMVYDKKIDLYIDTLESLLVDLISHYNDISNKIECDDLDCDVFFTKKQDKLEQRAFDFLTEISNFKSQLFQYLQSTIKHT